MIDYIEIKGYKSIKELRFDIKSINVLIGANGVGKSNFISFFRFLNNAYNQNLANYVSKNGGVNKFLYRGRKITKRIEYKISFDSDTNAYRMILEPGEEKFVVISELMSYKRGSEYDIASGGYETNIRKDGGFKAQYIRRYLETLKVYHFHDVGKDSPFNSDSKINDCYSLSSNGENLASVLYHYKNEEAQVYNRIVKTIQAIAPYFLDFVLKPNSDNEYIRLAWQEKDNELVYGVTDFSDGTMRFVALVTLFLQPNLPKAIIIDEPELGLHPTAIAKLAGLIKSASQRYCQVVLATQSVELVNCFAPEDIVVVDKKAGESTLSRLDSKELGSWLEEYSIGDLWKQNIINKGQPSK